NSTGSFKNYLDNSLNFTDIVNTEESIASGMLNNRTYKNGLIIHLDGKKANELLKDYREIFPINFLGLSVDKTSAYTQLAQEKTCASDSTKC
ncbi:hypothetical protein, partial [Helicobacter sp. 13S00482-2]